MDLRSKTAGQLQAIAEKRYREGRELRDRARNGGWTDARQRRFDKLMDEAFEALDERDRRYRQYGDEKQEPIVGIRGALSIAADDDNYSGGAMNVEHRNDPYQGLDADINRRWSGREKMAEWLRGRISDAEFRAGIQSVGTSGQGGVLAPDDFRREVFNVVKASGGLRRTRATIVQTDHGRDLAWPGIDDTGNTASIVAEGSTIASTTGLEFNAVKLEAAMYQAGPVLSSIELIQDAEIDVVGLVGRKLGERIARATGGHFATRSSTETVGPHGLVNASSGAVSIGASSTNLTLQLLRNLFFSVDPAWRQSAEWAVSDAGLQAILDLEDNQGRPLVEPSAQRGVEVSLLGKPVRVVADLPGFAATGDKPIWFGDFSAFSIRDVRQLEVMRLSERYAEKRQVGFLAFSRHDSRPLFSSTYAAARRPLRCIVVAT